MGLRLYRDGDFVRLQQIVTLMFIGFSLKEINRLIEKEGSGLPAELNPSDPRLRQSRERIEKH